MKKKLTRKLIAVATCMAFYLAYSFAPRSIFAAASGSYTDLLPVGAAGNTTVISNGTGWSLTTLPPTQTFGDSLSRLVTTVYQSTATATINATTTVSTFSALGQGNVGSTTFPAAWIASGRSIRVTTHGTYSTSNTGSTWTWGLSLGTTSVLTTGAITNVAAETDMPFVATAYVTVLSTGNTGTVFGSYDVMFASGTTPRVLLSASTATISGNITVDLLSQVVVNPTFKWTTANSSITVRNVQIEFLN